MDTDRSLQKAKKIKDSLLVLNHKNNSIGIVLINWEKLYVKLIVRIMIVTFNSLMTVLMTIHLQRCLVISIIN